MTAVVEGDVVWAIVVATLVVWLVVAALVRSKTVPGLAGVFEWLLRSWCGRVVLLLLWAEAGWHLFTQRP